MTTTNTVTLGAKNGGYSAIVVGVVFLFVSVFLYQSRTDFIANSTVYAGVIDRIESHRSGDDTEYDAIITYQDENGQPLTVRVKGSSSLKYADGGDELEIRIDNRQASNIVINNFWQLWGTLGFVGLFSLICLAAGIMIVLKGKSPEDSEPA